MIDNAKRHCTNPGTVLIDLTVSTAIENDEGRVECNDEKIESRDGRLIFSVTNSGGFYFFNIKKIDITDVFF